jgi:hypothetical protein
MAQTNTASRQSGKKMEYRKVSFDVTEIAPDAPEGEWQVSIPRGKCKVQPTQKDNFPMLIVPVRLDGTDEEGEQFEKALGVELSTMIVFFDNSNARAARMSKMRLRQLCEAADVDLDTIPKEIGDDPPNELEPLIRALEGAKFTAWTRLSTRKDTGEVTSELVFVDPSGALVAGDDDDDDDDDDRSSRRRSNGAGRTKKKAAPKKKARSSRARR